jgi:hypothetical protein
MYDYSQVCDDPFIAVHAGTTSTGAWVGSVGTAVRPVVTVGGIIEFLKYCTLSRLQRFAIIIEVEINEISTVFAFKLVLCGHERKRSPQRAQRKQGSPPCHTHDGGSSWTRV